MVRRSVALALLLPVARATDSESCALLQVNTPSRALIQDPDNDAFHHHPTRVSTAAPTTVAPTPAPTHAPTPQPTPHCAAPGSENCLESRCCQNPSQRCFKKNEFWAACFDADKCHPGMIYEHDPPQYKTPWLCEDITRPQCAAPGSENCLHSKCCKNPSQHCFQKNEFWAACLDYCTPGMIYPYDPVPYRTPWSCNDLSLTVHGEIGEKLSLREDPEQIIDVLHHHPRPTPAPTTRAPTPAPTHAPTPQPTPHCAAPGSENCLESRCCQNPSQRCFKKNDFWAACFDADKCHPGMIYEHDPPQYKTPWLCEDITRPQCAAPGSENCLHSKCCKNPSQHCFQKNEFWAACLDYCTPGMIYPYDPVPYRTPWSCNDLSVAL